jgi:hypothetical protein
MHLPPQLRLPGRQPAQAPLLQATRGGQTTPHPPQLFGSPPVSMQAPLQLDSPLAQGSMTNAVRPHASSAARNASAIG